jgi:hypothetical protein
MIRSDITLYIEQNFALGTRYHKNWSKMRLTAVKPSVDSSETIGGQVKPSVDIQPF